MKKTFKTFGWSKTAFARGIGLVLLGVLAGGCPANKQTSEDSVTTNSDGKIVIRGSNTIGEELAPRLIAEFKKDHPAAAFDLESKATGYGLATLRAGKCDLAGASRPMIKDEIEAAKASKIELNDYVIGSYSIAVTVNANNPVINLTKEQVKNIFTGTVTNWKDVGGPDAEIHLYVRDPISGTYLGFKEIALDNKPYLLGAKYVASYAGIVDAVAQDPNGIGYASIDLATKSGVKGLSIDGVAPKAETVNNGKYPYVRTLHFFANKAHESATTHDFVQYVMSPKGQAVMSEVGYVPHP